MPPLTDLKKDFEKQLQEQMDILLADFGPAYSYVKEYTCSGGKYVRPLLFLESFQLWGGIIDEKIMNIAVAIELIHNFFLVHDDIMDDDELRRDKLTLHAYFSRQTNDVSGRGTALIFGDVLFNEALRLMNISLDILQKGPVFTLVFETVKKTACGQIWEGENKKIPTLEEILSFYEYKTALYSIYFPLVLAAILRGKENELENTVRDLASHLGVAYQMYDDILEVQGEKRRFHNDTCGDIQRLKITPVLLDVLDVADERLQLLIREKHASSESLNTKEEQEIMTLIHEKDILSRSKQRIKDALSHIRICMKDLKLQDSELLRQLVFTYENC